MFVNEPRNDELFRLVYDAVVEGRRAVLELQSTGKYIGSYFHWPQLSWFDSGFPSIHHAPLGGGTDYSDPFSLKEAGSPGEIGYQDLPSFRRLMEYGRQNEVIRRYYSPPRTGSTDPMELVDFGVGQLVTGLIDRSIHLYPDDNVGEDEILPIYLELEAPLFQEWLPVELLIPLVLTKVDTEETFAISTDVWIEMMDEQTHLARYPRFYGSFPAHDVVIAAATHAFVLDAFEIRSETYWLREHRSPRRYPMEKVELLFAALRIVTGLDTGYAQIVIRPKGWAEDYVGTLPALIPGPTFHRYPAKFDEHDWLRKDRPGLTEDNLGKVAEVFSNLTRAPSPLLLAVRRLDAASLRDDETDAVIDLCTGLETLLTDEERTELTHKLALRVAALVASSSQSSETPGEVFSAVKRIYNYRSRLIHGRADSRKLATLKQGGEDVRTVDVARDYLRRVIRSLSRRPELLDPTRIDMDLIASALEGLRPRGLDDEDQGPRNRIPELGE